MYLVFNKNGNMPQFVHETEESARKEAERLARNHRGEKFYVFEAIACVTLNEFKWAEIRGENADQEIPF